MHSNGHYRKIIHHRKSGRPMQVNGAFHSIEKSRVINGYTITGAWGDLKQKCSSWFHMSEIYVVLYYIILIHRFHSTHVNTSLEFSLMISVHSVKSRIKRYMEEKVIVAVCGLPELYNIYIISYNISYHGQKLCAPPADIMNHQDCIGFSDVSGTSTTSKDSYWWLSRP